MKMPSLQLQLLPCISFSNLDVLGPEVNSPAHFKAAYGEKASQSHLLIPTSCPTHVTTRTLNVPGMYTPLKSWQPLSTSNI